MPLVLGFNLSLTGTVTISGGEEPELFRVPVVDGNGDNVILGADQVIIYSETEMADITLADALAALETFNIAGIFTYSGGNVQVAAPEGKNLVLRAGDASEEVGAGEAMLLGGSSSNEGMPGNAIVRGGSAEFDGVPGASAKMQGGNSDLGVAGDVEFNVGQGETIGKIRMDLPAVDPADSGALWNDADAVKVSSP